MSQREREQREAKKVSASDWAEKQKGRGFERTAIRLPEGWEMYKLEEGVHDVDVMPFIVGKGNPAADEGYQHFERQWGQHRVPKANGFSDSYCCAWECFKKPCYVCRWLTNFGQKASKDMVKGMKIGTRHLWIFNPKPGEANPPYKLFDSNDWNRGLGFRELMQDALKVAGDAGSDFSDLKNGMTLRLTIKEQPPFDPKGKPYPAVVRIDLVARKHRGYPDDLLDKMPCLDDCLIEFDADKMEQLLTQGGVDNNKQEESAPPPPQAKASPPATKPAPKPEEKPAPSSKQEVEVEVGDTVKHRRYGKCEVLSVSDDGKLKLKDEDDDVHRMVKPDEVTFVEKGGKPAAPKQKEATPPPAAASRRAAPVDDDDD